MDADTTTDPPTTDPPTAARPGPPLVRRARQGRMLGGVCEGLGRAFGVDPVIFRVLFPVFSLLAGSGILVYLIAWAGIPEDGRDTSLAEDALTGRGSRRGLARWLPVVPFALAGVVVFGFLTGTDTAGASLAVMVAGAVGVLVWARSNERTEVAPTTPATPGTVSAPPPPGAAGTAAVVAPTAGGDEPTGEAPADSHRHRDQRSLGSLTASLIVLAGGICLALNLAELTEITLQAFFAGSVIAVGVALVVGAWYGSTRGLITLGSVVVALFLVTSAVGLSLGGGAGDRTWRPADVAELRPAYRLGAGQALLDLSDLEDLPAGTTAVAVRVGAGQVRVIVPDDAAVDVDARTGIGEVSVLGSSDNGFGVRSEVVDGSGPRTIRLDARVGLGQVEVHRATP